MAARKRWKLVGILALFTLFVYLFPFLVHPPRALKDVYPVVRKGMTATEVEAIFGKPYFRSGNPIGHDYSLHYRLADGSMSISYSPDGTVDSVTWVSEDNRFWQSVGWLLQ